MDRSAAAETPRVLPPLSREARIGELRSMMGEPDRSVVELAVGIRRVTARHFDRYVVPLIQEHWPALERDPFGVKLRLAACDLYATAPYTVLFCAPNRPLSVALVAGAANLLPLPNRLMGLAARSALELLGHVALAREHRRIILIASFIAVIDHAFDHCMDDPPVERGRKMHALLDGDFEPDAPPLRLTRALQLAMSADLADWEVEPFTRAVARLKDWVDAEVDGMTGRPDPTGLGHRLAGVEGTIDGILFPVHRYAGEQARQWMYDVSLFIQMLDDYIDWEKDLDDDRLTPVIAGEWSYADVENAWKKTVRGIEDLTRAGGLRAPHYVRFVKEAYVLMLIEVLEGMASGLAD